MKDSSTISPEIRSPSLGLPDTGSLRKLVRDGHALSPEAMKVLAGLRVPWKRSLSAMSRRHVPAVLAWVQFCLDKADLEEDWSYLEGLLGVEPYRHHKSSRLRLLQRRLSGLRGQLLASLSVLTEQSELYLRARVQNKLDAVRRVEGELWRMRRLPSWDQLSQAIQNEPGSFLLPPGHPMTHPLVQETNLWRPRGETS